MEITVHVWEKDGEEWVSTIHTGYKYIVKIIPMSADCECQVSNNSVAQTLSWRKRDQWVMSDDGDLDGSPIVDNLAGENISRKGRQSKIIFDETVSPAAGRELFLTAFGYFNTMDRKPFTAKVDV